MGKRKRKEKFRSKAGQVKGKKQAGSYFSWRVRMWSVALLAAIITLIIYLPALNNKFVNWDDDEYVTGNIHIRSFNLDFFKWIFQFHAANWHPLTWLSHAIDYSIWKLDPIGHHLSSVILHSMNTFLLSLLVTYLVLNYKPSEPSDAETRISSTGLLSPAA